MWQAFIEPKKVTEAELVACHWTKGSGWSLRHPEGGFRRFGVRHQVVREPQQGLVLMVDPRASLRWRDLGEGQALRGTCGLALVSGDDPASPCRRIAPARWCRISALWENDLQRFDDQLHPAVFLDGQQCDYFAACCNDNRNNGQSGGIHLK